jgi:hypothetical protein
MLRRNFFGAIAAGIVGLFIPRKLFATKQDELLLVAFNEKDGLDGKEASPCYYCNKALENGILAWCDEMWAHPRCHTRAHRINETYRILYRLHDKQVISTQNMLSEL